jgi:hypothetical protein
MIFGQKENITILRTSVPDPEDTYAKLLKTIGLQNMDLFLRNRIRILLATIRKIKNLGF